MDTEKCLAEDLPKNVQIHKIFIHFRGLPERGFAKLKNDYAIFESGRHRCMLCEVRMTRNGLSGRRAPSCCRKQCHNSAMPSFGFLRRISSTGLSSAPWCAAQSKIYRAPAKRKIRARYLWLTFADNDVTITSL